MAAISSLNKKPALSSEMAQIHRTSQLRNNTWAFILGFSLLFSDLIAINASFVGIYIFHIPEILDNGLLLPADFAPVRLFLLLLNLAFSFALSANGLYALRRGASRIDEAYKVFMAISLATVLGLVINALLPQFGSADLPWTPMILVLSWLTAIFSTIALRLLHRRVVFRLRAHHDIDTRRALIVGTAEPGRLVWATIRHTPALGYRVQGFVSDEHPVGTLIDDLPVLGSTNQLNRVIQITQAAEVLVALTNNSQSDLLEIVHLAEDQAVSIRIYPDTFQLITNNEVSIGDLNGLPLVSVKNAALDNPLNQLLKRILDLLLACLILVATAPLLLLLAVLVKLDSEGPVFFLQARVGMDGKPFYMLKFRTMRTDAEAQGPGWTKPADPRVTRLGSFLRRSSLDELPQFINVLLGEMSIVGPRPEQPKWVEQFRQQVPRYMRRHKEKAGITGWAQVNGFRGDTSIEERTRYDLYYIENWSLLFDIKIIVRTAANLLTANQKNAY